MSRKPSSGHVSNHSPTMLARGPAVTVTTVGFVNPTNNARLAGLLFEPAGQLPNSGRRPGVVAVGPMFAVKEQAASVYARRMAQLGYVAIAFDHSSFGDSEGEPRLNEDPFLKAEDIKSAVTYLSGLPQVDPERIAGVGVCGGGGYLPLAAASDPRLKVLASIVPHTRQQGQVASGMGGLYGNGTKLLARARKARDAFAHGEAPMHLTFMPRIPPIVRTLASFFSPQLSDMLKAIDYYERRDRGFHPNRKKDFLIWSVEAMARYNIADALLKLDTRPLLVITSERDYSRADGEKMYAEKKGPKAFHLVKGAGHFDMYDLEPYVSEAIEHIGPFFAEHLLAGATKRERQAA